MRLLLKVHKCRFENLPLSSSSQKNNLLKISHQNTFYVLRYRHVRYVKSLITNIKRQQNMLKISLLFLRNLQTSLVNNSTIIRIKNAKFSRYRFYINTNIQGDFQICISVPLNKYTYKMLPLKIEMFSPNFSVIVVNKHVTYIRY